MRLLGTVVLCVSCCVNFGVRAGELKAEEFLPENTFAAFLISDLAGARAAAGKARLADMFSQPEMQEFLAPALNSIRAQYDALKQKNPLLPAWADVDGSIFSGEIAVAVYGRPNDVQNPIGLVVSLQPKDAEAFKRVLPPPMRAAIVDGFQMPMGRRPEDPVLAVAGSRLVFCVPGSEAPAIIARVKDAGARAKSLATTAEFKSAREKCKQSAAFFYSAPAVGVQLIVQASAHNAAADVRPLLGSLKALGLDTIESASGGIGFAGGEPVFETYTAFKEGPRQGFFALMLPPGPCAPESMQIAAADAPYAGSMYFDIAGLIPLLKKVVQAAAPEAQQQIGMVEMMMQQNLKMDIQKELLENLGGSITFAQTALDTGAPLSFSPGIVFSLPVKNPKQVDGAIAKLGVGVNALYENIGRHAGTPFGAMKHKTIAYAGSTIHYFSGTVLPGPGAMMVYENRLLLGSSVNTIRRTVEQLKKGGSILENKDFQATLARISGKPFDAKALPPIFAYSIDASSGTGPLVLTSLGLAGATAALAGLAEIPTPPAAVPPGGNAAFDPKDLKKNEEQAVAILRTLAEAQEIFHRTDYNKDGVLEYSQALKGAQSLFEIEPNAGELQLISKEVAEASGNPGAETNHKGYRFKLLKGTDTSNELGGKKSFLVEGRMQLGFAFVAYPFAYGASGSKTFQISHAGTVFEKDLGEKTLELIGKQEAFNPDPTWKEHEDDMALLFEPPENEFQRFTKSNAGKTAMAIAENIDLGLWPDEGFFIKYRRSAGMAYWPEGNTWYGFSDLPGPSPRNKLPVETLTVAGVAVVAAIAIPSLLRSRMAANETAAAAGCKAFAEAQEIYHRTDYDKDGILEYAQSIGGDNSLLETKAGLKDILMVDPAFATAEGDPNVAIPKAGYCFKVLKKQGEKAPGGKRSFLVGENMTLAYALVAYPAAYDNTGRNTFMISSTGTIWQCDLGPETHAIVKEMTEFNPDPDAGWVPAE